MESSCATIIYLYYVVHMRCSPVTAVNH